MLCRGIYVVQKYYKEINAEIAMNLQRELIIAV